MFEDLNHQLPPCLMVNNLLISTCACHALCIWVIYVSTFYPLVQVKVVGRDSVLGPYCNSESNFCCNYMWSIIESDLIIDGLLAPVVAGRWRWSLLIVGVMLLLGLTVLMSYLLDFVKGNFALLKSMMMELVVSKHPNVQSDCLMNQVCFRYFAEWVWSWYHGGFVKCEFYWKTCSRAVMGLLLFHLVFPSWRWHKWLCIVAEPPRCGWRCFRVHA